MFKANQIMIDEIKSWLMQAGEIALNQQTKLEMFIKEDQSPVTNAEYAIEKMLIEKIQKNFPGHKLITEESGENGEESEYVWALDPVDGTRVFLGGLPGWGVSLGLFVNGKPELGFFYMPATGDFFCAWDKGVFWGDRQLKPLTSIPYEDPVIYMGVPSNTHLVYDIDYPRVRSFGSTAAHFAWLCRGVSIGALTRRVYIWDLAGALPMMEKLNIKTTYLSGKELDIPAMLNANILPEPVISAPVQWFDRLREAIQPKQ